VEVGVYSDPVRRLSVIFRYYPNSMDDTLTLKGRSWRAGFIESAN